MRDPARARDRLGLDAGTIRAQVAAALAEDVGSGDVTAALVPQRPACMRLLAREPGVLCGCDWFEQAFQLQDPGTGVAWARGDGERFAAGETLAEVRGPARALLTAERTALNFLQTLSGTATTTASYVAAVAGTRARILDTRKTIPGLRRAQKYAVWCGGGENHRLGLFDMVLVKENHIRDAGSLAAAVEAARTAAPDLPLEVEVETLDELDQALALGVERILLDNMPVRVLREAVARTAGRAKLEASGGVTLDSVRAIAETGVDFISVGALTKDLHAVDLSLGLVPD